MEASEENNDRIELVIETGRPGRFVGQPDLLDRLKQTISQMTEIEDVRIQVVELDRSGAST